METVSVSGLKNNPSEALRMAHRGVVLVMNRDKPDALMVGVESAKVLGVKGVRPALATALFRDGNLSLAGIGPLAGLDTQCQSVFFAASRVRFSNFGSANKINAQGSTGPKESSLHVAILLVLE